MQHIAIWLFWSSLTPQKVSVSTFTYLIHLCLNFMGREHWILGDYVLIPKTQAEGIGMQGEIYSQCQGFGDHQMLINILKKFFCVWKLSKTQEVKEIRKNVNVLEWYRRHMGWLEDSKNVLKQKAILQMNILIQRLCAIFFIKICTYKYLYYTLCTPHTLN